MKRKRKKKQLQTDSYRIYNVYIYILYSTENWNKLYDEFSRYNIFLTCEIDQNSMWIYERGN